MFIQAKTLDEAIAQLEPPRSTLFRWFSKGKASYTQTPEGFEFNLPPYTRKAPPSPHRKFIAALLQWRSCSLGVRPWSVTYKKKQKEYLEKYFKKYPVVSAESLRAWLEESDPHRLTLRRLKHTAVSGLAKYLYEVEGLINFDEYTKIRTLYPRKPPGFRRKVKYIYDEDLEAILKVAAGVDRSLIVFLSETALRVSEALNLETSDVRFSTDPREAIIFIREDVGKGSKARIVPFSKAAQEAIRHLCEGNRGRIFPYRTVNRVHKRFGRIADKSKVPFSPHSFRHYRISKWANTPRIPITTTQKWAGHTRLAVTEGYITIRDIDALIAAFE